MRISRYFLMATTLFLVPQSPQRQWPTAPGFQDLTLTLATTKAKYVELQPIPLLLTLKNETNRPLVGHRCLRFACPYLRLYIDRGDGPQEVGHVSLMSRDAVANGYEFKPGEDVKDTERLYFGLNELFPKPGTYQLSARLISHDGAQTISSKPTEVEIVPSEGHDADALEFIRTFDKPDYLFSGTGFVRRPDRLRMLEEFVAKFGESAYGDDALMLLGEVRFAQREYPAARAIFEKLAKKPGYPFTADASRYLTLIAQREETERRRNSTPH
jgi:hypothetical protein